MCCVSNVVNSFNACMLVQMFFEQMSEIRDSENNQYAYKRRINFFDITDYDFLGAHTEDTLSK